MSEKLKYREKGKKINKPKSRPKYRKSPEKIRKKSRENFKSVSKRTREKYNVKRNSRSERENFKRDLEISNSKIDISTFEKKVLEPVKTILTEAWYWKFDTEILLKIWLIENMGWKWSQAEFEAALKRFSWNNYKNLMKVRSHAWARWVFQVMPATAKWLNRVYKIPNLIAKHKTELQNNYGYQKEDFDILLNALQWAFMLIETKLNYWLDSEKELAWAYNMWPVWFKKSMRNGRLNSETSAYLKKMDYASNNLDRYTA